MRTWTRGLCLAAATAAVVVLAGGGGPGAAADPPAKKKGDADGENNHPDKARWEWKLLDKKGKSTETGTFFGYRTGEIKHGKDQKQIGSFTAKGNEVTAKFEKGPLKGGTAELKLAERKPLKYRGTFTRGDKTKSDITVEIIND